MMPEETDRTLGRLIHMLNGSGTTHTSIKRHRSRFLFLSGAMVLFLMSLLSICVGPTHIFDPVTALTDLFTAIGNSNPTSEQITVFDSRVPRTFAAIAVGIGLSVAGAAYQAVIRNPLVDPYIMGVSSGAGTLAIAAIAFDFTFFGLMPSNSVYLTAVSAIVGGLIAFGMTLILARKAGGSTNSYVLAGVVVGLVFSAIQTVMIVFSGHKISNALLWLFGSFSSVTWDQAACIIVPSAFLSLLVMGCSKELNLVLLGDSQARQMGLNVDRFNALILIIASVLTAFCVAFVGIIGFVGLVAPHLCRMIFGGDHRLVLPSSVAFGGVIMITADLLSRMAVPGTELPVGAITIFIGVPMFVYLLFKRGRVYNG